MYTVFKLQHRDTVDEGSYHGRSLVAACGTEATAALSSSCFIHGVVWAASVAKRSGRAEAERGRGKEREIARLEGT